MACSATHQADAVPSIPDMLAGGKMSPCERGSRIESTAISLDDVFVPPHQETCLGILWGRSAQDDARTSEFGVRWSWSGCRTKKRAADRRPLARRFRLGTFEAVKQNMGCGQDRSRQPRSSGTVSAQIADRDRAGRTGRERCRSHAVEDQGSGGR